MTSTREHSPHLQIDSALVRVAGKVEITNAAGQQLEPGTWRAPEAIHLRMGLEVTDLRRVRRSCGLMGRDKLVAVLQVAGSSIRSRLTIQKRQIRGSGIIELSGVVPEGQTDSRMSIKISVQLDGTSEAPPPAARRPGAVLWSRDDRIVLGDFIAEVQVLRAPFDAKSRALPWYVDVSLSDLDRPFTEAVVVRVNSDHPLGQEVDGGARGPTGKVQRAITTQMYRDVERQLLAIALCEPEIRERPYVENGESLGDVLRHRISVALPHREPESAYNEFTRQPVLVERDMVRMNDGR